MAEYTGGSDGTDRDRTDSTYDTAVHYFTGSRNTKSSSKLDYLARQDSIATLRLQFVFNTSGTPTGSLPPEVLYFAFPSGASGTASDHLPVIIDVILCTLTYEPGDCNCDGAINGFDIDPFLLVLGGTPPYTDYYALYPDCDHMQADVNDDGAINGFDIDAFVALLGG
ncbi:MAG: hypothetical protein KKB50_20175 [Planctomycetes bacterium]|nr:hypothetical protein [Planctomycetota bacterium]